MSPIPSEVARFGRVLYVDDLPDVADSAVMVLRLFGVNARAAYGGVEALAAAAAFDPGVCFLDLNMPGMDGDELAVRLTAQAAPRPVLLVAVTAKTDVASRRRLAAAGFHLHLIKSADPMGMVQALADHAARGGSLPPALPPPAAGA